MLPELEGFVVDERYRWGGERCFWCARKVRYLSGALPNPPPDMATRDHLIPRMQRPLFNLTNGILVLACFKCNNGRGANMRWRPPSATITDNAEDFILRTRHVAWRVPEYMKPQPPIPKSRRKRKIRIGQARHGI